MSDERSPVTAEWDDGELQGEIDRLAEELADIIGSRRVSRETARRRLELLRTRAREDVGAEAKYLADWVAVKHQVAPKNNLGELWVLGYSDFVDRAIAAVDELPVGTYAAETDAEQQADLDGRRDTIESYRLELERRAVAREEAQVQERKRGLLQRIGGKA